MSVAGRAIVLAVGVLLGAPILWGASAHSPFAAAAHSQLVSSQPGNGETLATAPREIRLVFSESIDPRYTSLDLIDSSGTQILQRVGAPDPADDRVLVAPIPGNTAVAGALTVQWRTLSVADGHSAAGFFSFGVGDVTEAALAAAGPGEAGGRGQLHGGHSLVIAAIEVPGRTAAYVGPMAALGIAIIVFVVLRPAAREEEAAAGALASGGTAPMRPRRRRRATFELWPISRLVAGAPRGATTALLLGAVGCVVQLGVDLVSLPGGSDASRAVQFMTSTRTGQLLTMRLVAGLLGAVVIACSLRYSKRDLRHLATWLGAAFGLTSLCFVAAGSHAAAFASPVPMLVDVVHLAAASVWLAGLGMLVMLTSYGGVSRVSGVALQRIVPRFSALALVSVGAIALTGAYAAWVLTRNPIAFDTPYQTDLVAKAAVFLGALGLGAMNLMDGGQDRPWLGGLSRRVMIEISLAAGVLWLTANLTTGSPVAFDRPIAIAATAGSGVSADASLALLPGRAGPQRVLVNVAHATASAILLMYRLDVETGVAELPLRANEGAGGALVADIVLPRNSRWDASVSVRDANGTELGRQRFVFGIDDTGVTEGRSTPMIDPGALIAVALLGLAIVGVAFLLAGGVLPRTVPDASRVALLAGSTIAASLGVAIMASGVPS